MKKLILIGVGLFLAECLMIANAYAALPTFACPPSITCDAWGDCTPPSPPFQIIQKGELGVGTWPVQKITGILGQDGGTGNCAYGNLAAAKQEVYMIEYPPNAQGDWQISGGGTGTGFTPYTCMSTNPQECLFEDME